jgi:hypothetical protein
MSVPCPHCLQQFTLQRLDTHIRYQCPVLIGRRLGVITLAEIAAKKAQS